MYELPESPQSPQRPLPARPEESSAPLPVDPRRIARLFWRRRGTLVRALLLGAVLGVVLALTVAPRRFDAEVVLEADADALRGDGRDIVREIRTLVDGVKTRDNLAQMRERLGLLVRLESLGERLEVTGSDRTNLIVLRAAGASPEEAQRLAETAAQVFLDNRRAQDKTARELAQRRMAEAKAGALAELERRRQEFEEFRTRNHFVDLAAESQIALQEAGRLRGEMGTAQAEALAEEARASALQEAARLRPEQVVLSERQVDPRAARLLEAETELAGLRPVLSADHPKVQALQAQTASLRKGSEVRPLVADRVVGRDPAAALLQSSAAGAEAQRDAARQRQAALAQLAADAERRLTRFAGLETEASGLLSAVKRGEEHLADIDQRLAKAAEAASTPTAGVRVLVAARPPEAPTTSLRKPVAVLVPLLLLLAAVAWLLAGALRGLRLHTPVEVAYWAASPVVFSTTALAPGAPPAASVADSEVALDLAAPLRRAGGSTLVVPAGRAEVEQVLALAALLGWPLLRAMEDRSGSRAVVGLEKGGPTPGTWVWAGPVSGTVLRRTARQFDRVLVVAAAGHHSAPSVWQLPTRLGRRIGLGLALVGVSPQFEDLPDVAGDLARFWHGADAPTSHSTVTHTA